MTEYNEVSNSDVCMVDGKMVSEGYKVKDSDIVITLIRGVKERLGIVKNNRLYICKEHIDFYRKKRKSYERIVLLVMGLLLLLLFLGVLLPILWGTFSFLSFISYLMISIVMLVLLAFLHVPAVEEKLTIVKKNISSKTSGKASTGLKVKSKSTSNRKKKNLKKRKKS